MKAPHHFKQRQGGMATIVMLAILSLLCLYITANVRTLNRLEREIKLVDQHQRRRLMMLTPSQRETTNNIPPPTPAQPPPP